MRSPSVVFYGDFSAERISWDDLGKELGWKVCQVRDIDSLRSLRSESDVLAVFADTRNPLEYPQIKSCTPNARLVVCYPLSAPLLADDLIALGAFHSIPRPLNEGEVRQSFGFVWEAWNRRKRSARLRFTAA